MSFIEKIYDQLSLEEIICRIPSEHALNALKKRVSDLNGLKLFFNANDAGGASKSKTVKEHINTVLGQSDPKEIFSEFDQSYHTAIFGWLNDENKKKFVNEARDVMTIEFVYNISDTKSIEDMDYITDRILNASVLEPSKITTVLRSVEKNIFATLLNKVLRDQRPEARATVLSIVGKNFEEVSDHQKMIGLKAFAKLSSDSAKVNHINSLDFKLFKDLKPLERIMALDKYLDHFPPYKKIKAFDPEPSEDEMNIILFAGCFQYTDLIDSIKEKYEKITQLDKPEDETTT